MSSYTLETIATRLQGELLGNPGVEIHSVRTLEDAREGEISVVMDSRGAEALAKSNASAFIVPMGTGNNSRNLIHVSDPRLALIQLLELFYPPHRREVGIDPRAVISPQARLGPGVAVAAGAYIEKDALIGADVEIFPNVFVGEGVSIGDHTVILPNVTLYSGTRIGRNVRIHSGTVVGSDGFGYARRSDGKYKKIPQVGGVEIGDDVEIGANCAIDRATLGVTSIAAGTKIDNLVQIGHNSEIGQDCVIISQVGISGSVQIGNSCILAGQAGISDHVRLADGVVIGAQSGVIHSLEAGEWLGTPAIAADKARPALVLFARLPEQRKEIRDLQNRCARLEEIIARLQRRDEAGKE
ncbi:MAG TPA: UDP-3-O-(3-hydroxymyristoyl)glucosamine N-acyltransferase [Acidobacteriota bacterium]|jgi:UDP-3-O-[3-hydroxymyristoyl] glucosamine N-acyltransferase